MTKIIIVDSVKGGCGKTTMAIFSAINEEEKYYAQDQEDLKRKRRSRSETCIIDMDILGTSMEKMLFNKGFIKNKSKESDKRYNPKNASILKCARYYLNDLATGTANFKDDYISTVEMNLNDADKTFCLVDFIVSSADDKDRRKFKMSGDSNYTMQITPTHFRGIIKKLVENLIEQGYKTLVFDMPPNSDSYTDSVFDLFLNEEYRKSKKKDITSVELRIISTYDASHIYANGEWLKNLLEGPDHHWRPFDKIKFIFNNININDSELLPSTKEAKDHAESYIKYLLPKSTDRGLVEFLHKAYNAEIVKHFMYKTESNFSDFKGIDVKLEEEK